MFSNGTKVITDATPTVLYITPWPLGDAAVGRWAIQTLNDRRQKHVRY